MHSFLKQKRVCLTRQTPFRDALTPFCLIGEIKSASPTAGTISTRDPIAIARAYERGDAAAISVLTDWADFGGSLRLLREVRAATSLPILRKDFVVDPLQLGETLRAGADAVLLIVALLDERLDEMVGLAHSIGLETLVEVGNRDELERALAAGAEIIGVNNRNLHTLEVSLETAEEVAPHIPEGVVAIALSGIQSRDDGARMREAGYAGILVGESLMRAADPEIHLRELLR